jgi:diguanylate cyclase (GGDEF)-like protein
MGLDRAALLRPRPAGPFGALPPALRPLLGLTLAGVAVTVWSALEPSGWTASAAEPLQVGTVLTAALLCLARPWLVRVERAPWLLLGLGMLAWAIAEAIWAVATGGEPGAEAVSDADIAYLPCYPLLYVAVLLLIRAKAVPYRSVVWLDGIVGLLGLGAIGVTLAYHPIVVATGRDPASIAVGVGYLAGDLTLVGLIVLALSAAGFRERTWLVVGAGAFLATAADTMWLVEPPTAAATSGGWPNVLWPTAAVLFAVAAWRAPLPVRTLRLSGPSVLVMPALAVLGALTVLVIATQRPIPLVGVVLAAASVAGALLRAALTVREVQAAAATMYQAVTDELTGLGNRRLLLRKLDAVLTGAHSGRRAALLLLDLDRFKEVNDTLGHPVGDELLRRLGPRLAGATDPESTLARLGGDEFGILMPHVADREAAAAAADRVLAALAAPFAVDGTTLYAVASVGVAIAPDHGRDSAALMRRADVAMYHAKRERLGRAVYAPGFDRHSRGRLEAATALRIAIDNGGLTCHYQPQVELATNRLTGFEALARWHTADGIRQPSEFLGLAEQAGLMGRLTDAVLATALEDCRRWRDAGHDLTVSVNLAPGTLRDRDLINRVAAALCRADLPPSALTVELTEESLVSNNAQVTLTLAGLDELGVGVSIDDYGIGYSSLAYLLDLPAGELKLDRSFVAGVPGDPKATAIVRHTIELAHALGLSVVGEGIASAAGQRALRRMRCDRGQGDHIAGAMESAAVPGWLRAREQARTSGTVVPLR